MNSLFRSFSFIVIASLISACGSPEGADQVGSDGASQSSNGSAPGMEDSNLQTGELTWYDGKDHTQELFFSRDSEFSFKWRSKQVIGINRPPMAMDLVLPASIAESLTDGIDAIYLGISSVGASGVFLQTSRSSWLNVEDSGDMNLRIGSLVNFMSTSWVCGDSKVLTVELNRSSKKVISLEIEMVFTCGR